MKILVTGGAGFVGANLCRRLKAEGHDVVVMDNFYSSSRENVADFEVVEHDICEPWPSDLGDFNKIYHLACPASPPRYQKDHLYTLRVCYEGTRRVLEFAEGCGAKVLFTSTSEVYGDPDVSPQSEEYRGNVNPHGLRSCYDEGKRVAESLCMNYSRERGVDVKIVRIFNTYGPFMDPDDGRVVSNFIVQALKGEDLTIYGDGSQTRSFQFVDDLVDGMVLMMASSEVGPVNLGNPGEITVKEFAGEVLGLIGGDNELIFGEMPPDDPKRRCPDISLAKKVLGWEPKVSLNEGLKKTIEYFEEVV